MRDEQLLLNINARGQQLSTSLRALLFSDTSPAKQFVFDIRGAGLFWAIEFELPSAVEKAFGRLRFSIRLQMRAFKKGLLILGVGRPDREGLEGEHILLAPAYNVTESEIGEIVNLVVQTIDETVVKEVLPLL